ncbi:energy transducer TonB [Hyphomicrobium sp. 99]|uniref:energy transducer TonB family protein n=1 Tax=Hyphomicrobium sp. 99 TaxID=1163419 RepID=UPI0005F7C7DF|nr:TonB family protein [Hyphomicrobium sp. 99]
MDALRAIAILLSLLIHGTIGYAMLPDLENSNIEALDQGNGVDVVLVQQGIATEGISKLGDAMETIETSEIVPVQEQHAKPPEEVKPDELRDVITSDASEVVADAVKTQEPPPLETPPPEPQVVETKSQPEQVAIVTEQSSGEAKTGGEAKAFGRYLGQINDRVQRAKINPRSAVAGTVVMKFIVDVDGKLLSKEVAASSGSKLLDDAATAALDRAAPFPPIPPEVSVKPLAFTQPFKFIMR